MFLYSRYYAGGATPHCPADCTHTASNILFDNNTLKTATSSEFKLKTVYSENKLTCIVQSGIS